MIIETQVSGIGITRNGEFSISMVRVETTDKNMVKIGFISKCLKRDLHAGMTIKAIDMDKLAMEWIRKRNLKGKLDNGCSMGKDFADAFNKDLLVNIRTNVNKLCGAMGLTD